MGVAHDFFELHLGGFFVPYFKFVIVKKKWKDLKLVAGGAPRRSCHIDKKNLKKGSSERADSPSSEAFCSLTC